MFDPYHKWLGIPPKDQPPHHYRLLGIEVFESDADVIDAAANKQMAYVQSCATGPNLPLSQKLLNEIAAARLCLLDTKKKTVYDAQLKSKIRPAAKPATPAPPKPAPVAPSKAAPSARSETALPEPSAPTESLIRRPSLGRKSRFSPGVVAALVVVPLVIVAAIVVPLLMKSPTETVVQRGKKDKDGDRIDKDGDKVAKANPKKDGRESSDDGPATKNTNPDEGKQPVEPKEETKPAPTKPTITLEVDPPLAEVFIDDKFVDFAPASVRPFTIDVAAGKHELRVVRSGYQAHAQSVDTSAGAITLNIRLAPAQPAEAKIEPKMEPKVAARLPPPDAAAHKKAVALVQDVFKNDFAKAKLPSTKHALAQKLIQQGIDAKDDPAGRYALFTEARDLAAEAGAFGTTLEAIEQIGDAYDVDTLEMKTEALVRAGKATTLVPTTKAHAAAVLAAMNEAIVADDYAAAARIGPVAIVAARNANDAASFKQATARQKEVEEIRRAFDAIKKARDVLEKAPDDPDANLALGRHACFMKGAWEQGLPHLAGGGDAILKTLAEKELARPTEASDKAALGDGWWDVAQKETGLAKAVLAAHVKTWYDQAAPELSGLAKTKVEQRLTEIAKLTEGTSLAGQKGDLAPRPAPTADRPKHIPKDAILWAGNWYWFSESKATFDEAARHAIQLKGRLLTILNDKENSWVTSQMRGNTHLGLRKIKGVWINALNGRQVYFNWDRSQGQPSNSGGETYAAIHTTGMWHDYLANAQLYYCIKWAR